MDDKALLSVLSSKINFHRAAMIQATNSEQALAHEDSLRFYEAAAARLRELVDDREVMRAECAAWRREYERRDDYWEGECCGCKGIDVAITAATDARNALEKP